MDRQWTRLGIATLFFEWASGRTRSTVRRGHWHRAGLFIARCHVEIEVHITPFRYIQDTASGSESQREKHAIIFQCELIQSALTN